MERTVIGYNRSICRLITQKHLIFRNMVPITIRKYFLDFSHL